MRLLLLDIETSPNSAYCWGLFNQNINIGQLIDSSKVLCYSAKWLGDKEVMFDSIHKSKPKQMLKGIHGLLNDADAVISYNGRKFDLPILHKEFLLYNFNPPQPYKQIDLLNTMRQRFKFVSNKLDYVCQQLGLGKKTDHEGFELWLKCMNNDKEAWKRMEKYNKQDVVLLESLYNRVLPWIKNHPNMNLHQDHEGCPTCGSEKLQKRGTAVSGTGTYQRYQCRSCGTWSQGTKAIKPSVTLKGI
jgi:predicted PolB exonuclease-like 3'-5' exonuclease